MVFAECGQQHLVPIACPKTHRAARAYRRKALFLKTSAGGKETMNRIAAQGYFAAKTTGVNPHRTAAFSVSCSAIKAATGGETR